MVRADRVTERWLTNLCKIHGSFSVSTSVPDFIKPDKGCVYVRLILEKNHMDNI